MQTPQVYFSFGPAVENQRDRKVQRAAQRAGELSVAEQRDLMWCTVSNTLWPITFVNKAALSHTSTIMPSLVKQLPLIVLINVADELMFESDISLSWPSCRTEGPVWPQRPHSNMHISCSQITICSWFVKGVTWTNNWWVCQQPKKKSWKLMQELVRNTCKMVFPQRAVNEHILLSLQ